jgi:hypothetical protein
MPLFGFEEKTLNDKLEEKRFFFGLDLVLLF